MTLTTGHRLGPYEIREPIGAGGMGEVYRARDTRLGRDVAVKVLPEHVAVDPRALARFEREARAAAGLNDSRICALHDVGNENDVHYAVFELLEGETLRERLSRGALPPSKALELAAQICQGLAAAHARGIVHRDLKPENLFLTPAGLKILDFGLAKIQPGSAGGGEALSSEPGPGDQQELTRPGVAPGTVAYMSPEQVRGEAADARADIFAVGIVLHEMLSGRRPFQRSTHVETLTAILNEDPPAMTASGPVSPGLERIARRCLEKDPNERFQSARDLTFALEAVSEISGAPALAAARPPGSRDASRWVAPTLCAAAVVALLVWALLDRSFLPSPPGRGETPIVRSHIDLTIDRLLRGPWAWFRYHPVLTELALSPDAGLLVWTSRPDQPGASSALQVRRLDTGEVTRLPGTEGAYQPFFSPDGNWIGFAVGRGPSWLRKIRVGAELAVDLAELPDWPMGLSWGADGRIFVGSAGGGLRWVPAGGGTASQVTTVDRTREVGHRLPHLLPGGRELLMTIVLHAYGLGARVEVLSLATGSRKVIVEDAADARYVPTGHLVFVRRGVLMAAPFDLGRLELMSPPVPVLEGVSQALGEGGGGYNSGAAQYAASDSGLLAYASGGPFEPVPLELLLVDRDGRTEPLPGFDRPHVSPQVRYSPDGRELLFVEQAQSGLLWLFDVERHTFRPLSTGGVGASPRWSPDGTRIVTGWSEAGPFQLWLLDPSGGAWQPLTEGETHSWAPSWSPDGSVLAFVRGSRPEADIYLYRFEDHQAEPFIATSALEGFPEFSPDGRWLAYVSDRSGRPEVYVTSFPDRRQTLTVSREGGVAPAWSPDGRTLFYCSYPALGRRDSMRAVSVRYGSDLSLGRPTTLFRLPDRVAVLYPMRSFELHPDGRRFVVGRRSEERPTTPITRIELVHGWFAELERLAPTRQ